MIARWGSVDIMAENHQAITPYNYVLNNPLLYSDELGMDTTKRYILSEVDIVANAPKRQAFVGFWGNVNYYMNDGNFDGYHYNKDGKADRLAYIMGTAPDISRFSFGSVKSLSKLFSMSKWKGLLGLAKYSFKVSAKEGDVIFYTTKIGDDVIEFGGTFSKADDVLTIKGFDIDGGLTNKLGVKVLKEIMNDFGKSEGVSKIVVEGAKRTTGANPGRLPAKLIFDIK